MNSAGKIVIIVALIAAVGVVVALKQNKVGQPADSALPAPSAVGAAGLGAVVQNDTQIATQKTLSKQQEQVSPPGVQSQKPLPRLVDLGADKCIPCKMMAPILEGLKADYAGSMQVDFIDVWKNPDAGGEYGIRLIPTQVFFDGSGKELFRHEGFFSKKDILSKWKELGVELKRNR